MSNNPLITKFEKLVEDLNTIIFGDDDQDVILDDIVKPTISKWLRSIVTDLNAAIDIAASAGAGANGWTAQLIVDGDETQHEINEKTIRQVESISDLTTIANPKKGQVVFVKSYYSGLNAGGDRFSFTTTTQTPVQGLIVEGAGGYWIRDKKAAYSICDAGAHETLDMTTNTDAINALLQAVRCAYVPNGTFNIDILTGIRIPGNTTFFGYTNSVLLGQDADANMADVSGAGLYLNESKNFIVKNLTVKNGYRGKGIFAPNVGNGLFEDVTIDGFSYGSWVSENDSLKGSKNIVMVRPRILNTKYWGTYFRGLNIEIEADKTKNIKVINPYYYNCNMAAFVAAEGNVSNILLDNPVFERCNVCMHFEHASDYTVINPKDYDTGKKPDHLQANTEYPYTNWSMYHAFTQNAKILGGTLEKTCYHSAGFDAKSKNIHYTNVTAKDWVFEGVGNVADTDKNFFENYSWSQCTSTGVFIFQQPTDVPLSYLSDFRIINSECLLGSTGNSGNGSYVAVNIQRSKNFKLTESTIENSTLRIKCENSCVVVGNTFNGTDETQIQLDGVSSALGAASFLQFTGNIFNKAGGSVIGESAVLLKNWTRVRTDNTIRANNVNHGYKFQDNRLIELGYSWVFDTLVGNYTESNTTSLVYLYRD